MHFKLFTIPCWWVSLCSYLQALLVQFQVSTFRR